MIPFLDLSAPYIELKEEIDAAVSRVLNSGWFIGGEEVEKFEEEYAEYCNADFAIGVANGLDALHLALKAMGVRPGDEVIVPSNTYIATWLAVSQCGAIPVPVEPDPVTSNIDSTLIEAAITEKTKVLLPVHLYGQPADLDRIMSIAKRYSIRVLEDAAQAHGARYNDINIGSHGDAVAWSFYPGKNLGAMGDGGAVTTSNPEIADRIRTLRNYGSKKKYVNIERGFNSRLDPLQASILRVKLSHLDAWNERRTLIAQYYLKNLEKTSLILPQVPKWALPAWHLFTIQHDNRDAIQSTLQAKGVSTLIHYPIPPHMQAAYQDLEYEPEKFPIAKAAAEKTLSLPMGPHLTAEQARAVCVALFESLKNNG